MKLAALLLVACAAPKPEPLETPAPIDKPHELVRLAAREPNIDLQAYTPDISSYGRWPLTIAEHPELQPHFEIAEALAQPGIGWTDLCARGAQQRVMARDADYGDYLAAWCSIAKDNPSDALFRLGNLHGSLRLRAAIQLDAAAIVAASFEGKVVEGELRRANLLEVPIVDRISAAYFEVGKLDDASDLNRLARQMDRSPSAEAACARRLRAIADGGVNAQIELDVLAHTTPPKVPNPCETTAQELTCWTGARCIAYSAVKNDGVSNLTRARALWPRTEADVASWFRVANIGSNGWPFEGAYAIAVPALELALRTSQCDSGELDRIGLLATRLLSVPDIDAASGYIDDLPRKPLPPNLAQQYQDRVIALGEQIRRLRGDRREWCAEQLVGLPPVRVP